MTHRAPPQICAAMMRAKDAGLRPGACRCDALERICRLSPLWFLVPLLMQRRELGGARASITYRACMAARISK